MTDVSETILDADSPEGLSKSIKTILMACIGALLIWIAFTVQESTKQIAVLQIMVVNLQGEVKEAKGNTQDRYTSYDAEKDFRSRDNQISHNVSEIEAINKRLENIEISMRRR